MGNLLGVDKQYLGAAHAKELERVSHTSKTVTMPRSSRAGSTRRLPNMERRPSNLQASELSAAAVRLKRESAQMGRFFSPPRDKEISDKQHSAASPSFLDQIRPPVARRQLERQKTTREPTNASRQLTSWRRAARRASVLPNRQSSTIFEGIYQAAEAASEENKPGGDTRRKSIAEAGAPLQLLRGEAAHRRLSLVDPTRKAGLQQLQDQVSRALGAGAAASSAGDRAAREGTERKLHTTSASQAASRAETSRGRPAWRSAASGQASLSSIFRGPKEQLINHSIRRTAGAGVLLKLRDRRISRRFGDPSEESDQTPKNVKQVAGALRRLSRLTLGRTLALSHTAGLKLQWTVGTK
jgi:hypothetical protein